MQHRRVLVVDAFASNHFGGNPAGVLLDAEGLTEDQMQAIAAEIGASETAFVTPSSRADRRLRYFTPRTEVDLCGHATIASLVSLARSSEFDPGEHTIETNVGILETRVTEDGVAWMTQQPPSVDRVELSYDRVAAALGIDPAGLADIGDEMPMAVASTGLAFLLVPVAFLENLADASPDFDAIEALAAEVEATGIYAFTFDTITADATLHGRAFVPGVGVPEDPVTGTASGAVGGYLRSVEAFGEIPEVMEFEQGHFVDRPGIVRVRIGTEVEVGGTAAVTIDGSIAEPPEDDSVIVGS